MVTVKIAEVISHQYHSKEMMSEEIPPQNTNINSKRTYTMEELKKLGVVKDYTFFCSNELGMLSYTVKFIQKKWT